MWKKLVFGSLIATVMSGGAVWYNVAARNVITADDQADLVERYNFLCAVIAPWPFTTNAVTNVAWGVSEGYSLTNMPADARSWSFSRWGSGRLPVFGVHIPTYPLAHMMTNLPLICTNFVRDFTTNSSGYPTQVMWTATGMWAALNIGDGTSKWTVAYGTNGLPIYSNAPAQNVCTTLLWEIRRVETNLNMTTRSMNYVSRNTLLHRYSGADRINLGAWDYGDLLSDTNFAQYAKSSRTSVPSDVLISGNDANYLKTFPRYTWRMHVFSTNFVYVSVQYPHSICGEEFETDAAGNNMYYDRRVHYSSFPTYETYEALYDASSHAQSLYVSTNKYTLPIAGFPSNVTADVYTVSPSLLNWTRVGDGINEGITNQPFCVTGETVRVSFTGSLSTNIYTNMTIQTCPRLLDVLTEDQQKVNVEFTKTFEYFDPGPSLDAYTTYARCIYKQSTGKLNGSIKLDGNPICILKWTFTP